MRKYLRLIILLPVLFFLSCNDPLDKTYNSATYIEDISAMREGNKVSYEDIELLTKYIAVSNLSGHELQGKTYSEILEKIKDIRKANMDQSDQLRMEKDATRYRLGAYLKVDMVEKIFSKINSKDFFSYTVTFQNLSAKHIKMVIGTIYVNDLLDREIKSIQIVLDEDLRPNAMVKKTYPVSYDDSNENDKRIRSKNLVDLRILWSPEKIIFEDGTIAE